MVIRLQNVALVGLILCSLALAFLASPGVSQQLYATPVVTAAPTATASPVPTANPIKHIIVIFQENRSFNNLYAGMAGAAAYTTTTANVCTATTTNTCTAGTQAVLPFPQLGSEDFGVSHSHNNFITEVDPRGNAVYGGLPQQPNGWLQTGTPLCSGVPGTNDQCALYYVADNSGTCASGPLCTNVGIYWRLTQKPFTMTYSQAFQTNQGPSTTGHYYLVAAQAGYPNGWTDQQNGGCFSPQISASTVNLVSEHWPQKAHNNNATGCSDADTIFDLVHAKGGGLTSKYYWGQDGFWNAPAWISHLCGTVTGGVCQYNNGGIMTWVTPETTILSDATGSGGLCPNLASVSYVMPSAANSDHGGTGTNGSGPTWVASVINAVGNGPCWNSSEILLTWDDWGGWFDGVLPPVPPSDNGNPLQNPNEFGFRVPVLVISPYVTKSADFDNAVSIDAFSSVVKNIETTFALPWDPQCIGTVRSGGAFVPAAQPYRGLCQRDNRGTNLTDFYLDLNIAQAPTAFSTIAMTPRQQIQAIAGTTDNGAELLLSKDPKLRMLGRAALAYAKVKGWDSIAFRNRPMDDDIPWTGTRER